jgi:hypothetical protein
MGLSFTIAAGPRQCIHSHVRVPQDSWPHFTQIQDFPNMEAMSPYLYPPEQHGRVIPQALGSLSIALYDLQGYGGGDLNPPPHSGGPVCYSLMHKFEAEQIKNTAPNSASTFCVRIRCRTSMNWLSRVSCYDRRSAGQSAPEQSTHLGPTTILPPPSRQSKPPPPPLTRGRVRLPQPLPALSSTVNLVSESHGTRDHTPLSQIRDFPLHRLPRPTRPWWRHTGLIISIFFKLLALHVTLLLVYHFLCLITMSIAEFWRSCYMCTPLK